MGLGEVPGGTPRLRQVPPIACSLTSVSGVLRIREILNLRVSLGIQIEDKSQESAGCRCMLLLLCCVSDSWQDGVAVTTAIQQSNKSLSWRVKKHRS